MKPNICTAAAALATFLATSALAETYAPHIDPAQFTTEITNPYLTMPTGRTLVYAGETPDGLERIDVTMTGETREIMGVTTTVYLDRVYHDGQLVEETKDYLAQNSVTGDVWYFGEDVQNYENGQPTNTDGAWIAGEDNAQPGIWITASPVPGLEYRQEFYPGEAEDMVTVKEVGLTLETPLGTFDNCIATYDWTPLEESSKEDKFYCPGIAAKVATHHQVDGDTVTLIEASAVN